MTELQILYNTDSNIRDATSKSGTNVGTISTYQANQKVHRNIGPVKSFRVNSQQSISEIFGAASNFVT
jgi:hypothetical protein